LAVQFNLQRINRKLEENEVGAAIEELSGSIDELRYISMGLSPPFLEKMGFDKFIVGNTGAAFLIREVLPGAVCHGGWNFNVTNKHTLGALGEFLGSVCLSPELGRKELKVLSKESGMSPTGREFPVYGNMVTMVSRNNLLGTVIDNGMISKGKVGGQWLLGLRDSKNRVFPVFSESTGNTVVFNSAGLCLIDLLEKEHLEGLSFLSIDLRFWSPSLVGKVCGFLSRLKLGYEKMVLGGESCHGDLQDIKEELRVITPGGITAGRFLK